MKRILLLLLIPQFISAQSIKERMNLQNLFAYIESTYDIRFSYKTSLMTEEAVQNLKPNASLPTLFKEIRKQTSVFVQKIDERYYLILNKKEPGKFTLCGTLLNEFTGDIISDATIINLNSRQESTSDTKGYFELYLANKEDKISIRGLGFNNKTIPALELTGKTCPIIYLAEQSNQLDEILISDYLKDDLDTLGKDGDLSIDPNNVGTLPGLVEPDIFETLQILPGVQSTSESATDLLIRGGNPDQNLILLDGIKVYNNSHLFGAISIINPYTTENTELYRGDGVNPKYGGALGGIISITSKSNIPEKIEGSIGTTLVASDANIIAPIGKKVALITSARTSFNTFIENETFDNYTSRVTQNTLITETAGNEGQNFRTDITNKPEFIDGSLKVNFKPSPLHYLSLTSFYNKNTLKTLFQFMRDDDDTEYPIRPFQIDKEAYAIGFLSSNKLSEKLTLKINGYLSHYFEDFTQRLSTNPNNEGVDVAPFYNLKDQQVSTSALWKPSKSFNFQFGYDFSYLKIKNQFPDDVEDIRVTYGANGRGFSNTLNRTHALYTNGNFEISERLSIDIGTRASIFSILDNKNVYFEPRGTLRLKINKYLKARFSYSKNNQIIHQLSFLTTSSFSQEVNPWVLIDPEFYDSPLQNEQYSASLLFNYKKLNINVDIYTKETNLINSGIRGFQLITDIFTGNDTTYGLDLLIKKRIGNYRTFFTYSYMNQYFNFQGLNRNTLFPGNFDSTHNINWSHTLKINNLEFALGWNYKTGIPFTELGDKTLSTYNFIVFTEDDLINTKRLKPYHRLNLSTSYHFKFSEESQFKGKLTVSLLNLYDRQNEISIHAANTPNPNRETDEPFNIPKLFTVKSIGFTPNVSLRLKF